jgi:hypothetical protein
VQIHSFFPQRYIRRAFLGSLFIRRFHSILLKVWLTFAALRIFSLAASQTVEAHVSAVLRKLQRSNRYELSRWAVERRLVN